MHNFIEKPLLSKLEPRDRAGVLSILSLATGAVSYASFTVGMSLIEQQPSFTFLDVPLGYYAGLGLEGLGIIGGIGAGISVIVGFGGVLYLPKPDRKKGINLKKQFLA